MTRFTTTMLLLLLRLGAAGGGATIPAPVTDGGARVQVLDFGPTVVDGRPLFPAVLAVSERDAAEFERLSALRRSFLPELRNAGREMRYR